MEPGDLIAGRYEIERLCATGGMAVVYRARDAAGAAVAVKVLRGNATARELERFAREAEVLAALDHPAIVRPIDRGVTELGESYIVQHWIDGVTLRERLRTEPLTLRDSVGVARRVADALAAAHARGVVHRDIKPNNIMLVRGDPTAVVVVDFGIARILGGPDRRLTRTGAVLGTVNYMGPEQARGERDVGPRADVFALGAVLYECIVGHEAFRGKSVIATRAKIIALEPPPVPGDIPADLVALLHRFLAKAPADRPADGAAASAELSALVELPDRIAPSYGGTPRESTDPSDQFTCVVMSAPAAPLLGRTTDDLRREVDEISASFGCEGVVMSDGSALITSPVVGSPAARAGAATRAALSLKRLWDVVPIVVAGGLDASRAERSIDDRASALDGATLTTVFADLALAPDEDLAPIAGVMIEPDVAALIEGDFEITGDAGALRVVAARRPVSG